jgi:hypothetical protein
VCFTAAHKAAAMAKFWQVEDIVVESAFLAFEIITLAAVLLGPHDYHYVKKSGGGYSNTTGMRYESFHALAMVWKNKHRLVQSVVDATIAGKTPREITDTVQVIIETAWSQPTCGGGGKHGNLTFEKWCSAWRGFIHHPVTPTMGPDAPSIMFIDALESASDGVSVAGTAVEDAVIMGYEYEGGCAGCELHPVGYTPPTFPRTDADGNERKLEKMEATPRLLTGITKQGTHPRRARGLVPVENLDNLVEAMYLCSQLGDFGSSVVEWLCGCHRSSGCAFRRGCSLRSSCESNICFVARWAATMRKCVAMTSHDDWVLSRGKDVHSPSCPPRHRVRCQVLWAHVAGMLPSRHFRAHPSGLENGFATVIRHSEHATAIVSAHVVTASLTALNGVAPSRAIDSRCACGGRGSRHTHCGLGNLLFRCWLVLSRELASFRLLGGTAHVSSLNVVGQQWFLQSVIALALR